MRLHVHIFHFTEPDYLFFDEDGRTCWSWIEECRCGKTRTNGTGLRD